MSTIYKSRSVGMSTSAVWKAAANNVGSLGHFLPTPTPLALAVRQAAGELTCN